MPASAIADAELDAEVDAETDEQDGERDRYQVERAEHQQPRRRGNSESDEDACHHGAGDSPRPDGDPQQCDHRCDHRRRIESGAICERRELVVGERYWPGKPDADIRVRVEAERASGVADCRRRPFTRLQRRIVQHRLDEDEPAQCARLRRTAGEQRLPGECQRIASNDRFERRGQRIQRRDEHVDRCSTLPHAVEHQRHGVDHTAHGWIGRERSDHRLRANDPLHRLLKLVG